MADTHSLPGGPSGALAGFIDVLFREGALPPPSWAMRARQHTARDIQATKGQLLLELLELFWESERWFMLGNWLILVLITTFFSRLEPYAALALKKGVKKHVSATKVKAEDGFTITSTSHKLYWRVFGQRHNLQLQIEPLEPKGSLEREKPHLAAGLCVVLLLCLASVSIIVAIFTH